MYSCKRSEIRCDRTIAAGGLTEELIGGAHFTLGAALAQALHSPGAHVSGRCIGTVCNALERGGGVAVGVGGGDAISGVDAVRGEADARDDPAIRTTAKAERGAAVGLGALLRAGELPRDSEVAADGVEAAVDVSDGRRGERRGRRRGHVQRLMGSASTRHTTRSTRHTIRRIRGRSAYGIADRRLRLAEAGEALVEPGAHRAEHDV